MTSSTWMPTVPPSVPPSPLQNPFLTPLPPSRVLSVTPRRVDTPVRPLPLYHPLVSLQHPLSPLPSLLSPIREKVVCVQPLPHPPPVLWTPRLSTPPCYNSVATCVFTDNCFLLRVRSRTLCAQWMCHALSGLAYLVLPYHWLVHSYVSFSSYVFPLTRTNVACRLVTSYLLAFHFSFCLVNSSTYVSHLHLSLFVLSTRLPSRYFWTLTRY